MGKRLPKLKLREVKANLTSLGFRWKRTDGSHETWERAADGTRKRATVTVDKGKTEFDDFLMKSMIRQSLFSRDEFCTGIAKKSAPTVTPVPDPAPATDKSN
jgi:predicted RNA binding protein YcfA (HicA-like mRNA interferase family)